MLNSLKRLFSDLIDRRPEKAFEIDDPRLAVAALMFHVVAVDGVVTPQEQQRWEDELSHRFGLAPSEARALAEAGRTAELETADLMNFTSALQRHFALPERLGIVRALWAIALADGDLHEFEDNVVWRIADLLGIEPADRVTLRKEVEAEHAAAALRAAEEDR